MLSYCNTCDELMNIFAACRSFLEILRSLEFDCNYYKTLFIRSESNKKISNFYKQNAVTQKIKPAMILPKVFDLNLLQAKISTYTLIKQITIVKSFWVIILVKGHKIVNTPKNNKNQLFSIHGTFYFQTNYNFTQAIYHKRYKRL